MLLEEHGKRGAALLLVTHDVAWCPEFADRVVLLLPGKEPWSGPPTGLVSPAGIAALEEAGLEPPPLFVLAAEVAAATGRAPPSARTADLLRYCR